MIYQQESFEDIWPELEPLLHDHYHEVALYQDKIDLNVDKQFYELAQDIGKAFLHVARTDDNILVGYCVTFVNRNPHYSDHDYGVNDVLFVHPDYRGTEVAVEMVAKVERDMRELGVSVMTFHMKEFKPFRKLMEAMGFEPAEEIWTKYTGK